MRRLLPVFLCAALGAPAPCDGHPPLDLAAVEALRRDDAERRRAALDLAALELDAVAAGLFREGPALSVSAGPRFSPGATVSDLAAGVDVPVAFETRPSRDAARLLRERAGEVVSASELSARQRLRAAYAEAWLALERVALLDA